MSLTVAALPETAVGNPSDMSLPLTPCQQAALDRLERVVSAASVVGLIGPSGSGKSLVLNRLAARHDGIVISAVEMTEAASSALAASFDTAIGDMILTALRNHPLVVVDDVRFLAVPGSNASTRPGFFRTVLERLRAFAVASGHRLVLGGQVPESWQTATDQFGPQAAVVPLTAFGPADYAVIARTLAGEARVDGVDFETLHHFAGHLNGYQLRLALAMLSDKPELTTNDVIKSLETHVMVSNTKVEDVEAVSFDRLPGHEHIVESLMTNIVIPMENRDLAREMGLQPKRGVLLFGPPGTGKTTVGRALAHHMGGKFFLIDGSFVSEPAGAFFAKLGRVVQEAKENAPSVLFIDDADTLFEIQHIAGLSRYLLSLLDGIESGSANHVCVMMTATNVRPIPEALLRSGRVELWLETQPPDLAVRESILRRWTEDNDIFAGIDHAALAAITAGFTPADLRRLVGDGKSRLAADIVRDRPRRGMTEYFKEAVQEIVAVRNRMADTLGDKRLRLEAPAG